MSVEHSFEFSRTLSAQETNNAMTIMLSYSTLTRMANEMEKNRYSVAEIRCKECSLFLNVKEIEGFINAKIGDTIEQLKQFGITVKPGKIEAP